MRNLSEVEIKLRSFQHLKAFAIGLQHAVLDAVVNHFSKMACAAGADVSEAILRRQCLKDRLQLVDNRFFATDHQTVTFLQTPDAAAGAGIDEVNAKLFKFFSASDGIFVI